MMITLKNKKEKIAKGLSLALKIMSLLLVMHIVGCDKCDNDTPNAESSSSSESGSGSNGSNGGKTGGNSGSATPTPEPSPKFSIDVVPHTIYGSQQEAKITIQNVGDKEFNPAKYPDLFLLVSKPKIIQSAGSWGYVGYGPKELDPNIFGAYLIEGQTGAAGPAFSEFPLEKLIAGKIGPNLVTDLTFTFEGLGTKHGKDKPTNAEVTLKIVRRNKTTGKEVKVSGDDAKVIWKIKK